MRITKRETAIAAGTIVLLLGAGTVAAAAVPSADGVITACVSPRSTIRVIDAEAGEKCQKNEQRLEWNQAGRQGLPGEQGPAGPPGGLNGFERVRAESAWDATPMKEVWADCPDGKVATGGGFDLQGSDIELWKSGPRGTVDNSWYVSAHQTSVTPTNWRLVAYVICARVA